MNVPCKKCPKFASCDRPCDAIDKLLLKPLDQKTKSGDIKIKGSKKKSTVDLAKIKGEDLRNHEIEETSLDQEEDFSGQESSPPERETPWDQFIFGHPEVGPPLNEKEYKLLRGYILKAVPNRKKTIKNRFLAFMKCESIVKIARRANVKKQGIQKQFSGIISRMKDLKVTEVRFAAFQESGLTPLKFKKHFPIEKNFAY